MMQKVATLLPDVAATGNAQTKSLMQGDAASGERFAEQLSRQQGDAQPRAKQAPEQSMQQPREPRGADAPSFKGSEPDAASQAKDNPPEPTLITAQAGVDKPQRRPPPVAGSNDADGPRLAEQRNDDSIKQDWLVLIYQLLQDQSQPDHPEDGKQSATAEQDVTALSDRARQMLVDAGIDADAIQTLAMDSGRLAQLQHMLDSLSASDGQRLGERIKALLGRNIDALGRFESASPPDKEALSLLSSGKEATASETSGTALPSEPETVERGLIAPDLMARVGGKKRDDLFPVLPVKPAPDSSQQITGMTGLEPSQLSKEIKMNLAQVADGTTQVQLAAFPDTVNPKASPIAHGPDLTGQGVAIAWSSTRVSEQQQMPSALGAADAGPLTAEPAADEVISRLAALSDKNLDKVLAQVVRQLPPTEGQTGTTEFIASLKAGIQEFKQQLAQGREPGLDLQALAEATFGKTENAEVAVRQITGIVQTLQASLDSVQRQSKPDDGVELKALQAERDSTQASANVLNGSDKASAHNKLEQAINIARPEAAQQLAERIRVMTNLGNMRADIRLDPPDLGSMQIRIQMQGEQASVNFVVQSPQAKEMLDQAVPRLREMLAEKGIELGQSFVQQESGRQRQGQHPSSSEQGPAHDMAGMDSVAPGPVYAKPVSTSAIDYFV